MKEFRGRVAVITGAASGIGRALVRRAAREGMKLVLADVEQAPLDAVAAELAAAGTETLAFRCDVSDRGQVAALADATMARFGAVHVVVNCAGVASGSSPWESTWQDWDWVMGVNLGGVINGCKIFAPLILAHGEPGHIVNIASLAGVTNGLGVGAPYAVSKHGVVSLSEQLYLSLEANSPVVRASVVCPGWVNTRIIESVRNRPENLRSVNVSAADPARSAMLKRMTDAIAAGLSPDTVADMIFSAIEEERFWVYTHPDFMPMVQARCETMIAGRNPGEHPLTADVQSLLRKD